MFGVQELSCIFFSVVYLHFGLVSTSVSRFNVIFFLVVFLDSLFINVRFFRFTETEKGIFDAILEGDIDFESKPWPSIASTAKDLIRRMLTQDPEKRITSAQVLGIKPFSLHYRMTFRCNCAQYFPLHGEHFELCLKKNYFYINKFGRVISLTVWCSDVTVVHQSESG